VHAVQVVERVRGVLGHLGQRGVLEQQRRRVDPDAVHPAVEPEPQDGFELLAHLGVVPVEVGLLRGEQMQVPVTRRAVRVGGPGPRRAAELATPLGRHLGTVRALAGTKPEVVALRRVRRG
jgi:hypothetical protein